jgi:hypothetical protein
MQWQYLKTSAEDAVELVPEEKTFNVPQWQMDEIRERKKYYKEYPEELVSWENAWKMIKSD